MENIKVLVVDDESRMRKLVKDFLVPGKDMQCLRRETAWKRWTFSMKIKRLPL